MKKLTIKEAVEKHGTDGQKKSYRKKYSLTEVQKVSLENKMLSIYESVERTKNGKGSVVYNIGNTRIVEFPLISKSKIWGNNANDNLNKLLFQYVLSFLKVNELSEEGYYNLVYLESKFDILTNFTRQFVQYNAGNLIVNGQFQIFNRKFSNLSLNKKNQQLYSLMYYVLNSVISDFKERLLGFISHKIGLYNQQEMIVAVIKEESTSFNSENDSGNQETLYNLRGIYDNLSIVMKEHHDYIINELNETLQFEYGFSDVFNKEEKMFENLNFISEDSVNVNISREIYDDISRKLKSKEKELNLITRFHGRMKPKYLSSDDLVQFLEEDEIKEIEQMGQCFWGDKDDDYEILSYMIGTDGNNLGINDRLKLMEKYKNKFYKLKNNKNHRFYEISYFSTYYQFEEKMLNVPEYINILYEKLEIQENKNLSEIKIQIRELLKNRFEASMSKEISANYVYLAREGFDRLIMNNLVSEFSELILKS